MKELKVILEATFSVIKKDVSFYLIVVLLNFSMNIGISKILAQAEDAAGDPSLLIAGLIGVFISWFTFCGVGSIWKLQKLNWNYIARIFKRLPELLYFGFWYFFNFFYRIFLLIVPAILFALKSFFTIHILIHEDMKLEHAQALSEKMAVPKRMFILLFVSIMYMLNLVLSIFTLYILGDSNLRLFIMSCGTAFVNFSFGTYYFMMRDSLLKIVHEELIKRAKANKEKNEEDSIDTK